jgi:CHAT domain-containing protein/Tfp pilus assembly protein PilF
MMKPSFLRLFCCLVLSLAAASCAGNRAALPLANLGDAEEFMARAEDFSANAQYDGVNFFLTRAAEIYRSQKNWQKTVQCLVQIGNNWQKIGDMLQAKNAFAQALQIMLGHGEVRNVELAKSMLQLAFKLLAKKEFAGALELMNRSLALQQQIYGADHPELGKIYNSLALLYLHMGDTQKANEFANKSLSAKIRKSMDSDSSFLKDYSFLDGVRISERSFEDMSGKLDKSLLVYMESLGSGHPLVASIYEKLGMVCALQGSYEQGLDFFRKALRILLDTFGDEDIRIAVLYEEIGICLRLQGDLQNAGSYLQQALAIARNARQPVILASIYYQLGKICFLQKLFSEALENFQLSLAELAPDLAANAGAWVRAAATVPQKQNLLEILAAQAEAFAARAGLKGSEKNDLLSAFQAVQGAIRLIGLLRTDYKSENYRLLFGEKSQHVLDLAVRVALRLFRMTGEPFYRECAFDFSEKSKAALLSENMLESNARQFAGIPVEKLALENKLKNELVECETLFEKQSHLPPAAEPPPGTDARHRYFTLLAGYQELIASFERDYPRYFDLKYGSRNLSPALLQKCLPDDAALIEYFLGSTHLTIFVLSRDKLEVVHRLLEPRFAETVSAYCLAIKKIDERTFQDLGPKLYGTLIAPCEKWLRDKKKLLIIPDRALAYLPFETLVRDQRHVADFSRLDFLIRRFEISYHFSGQLWLSNRQKPSPLREETWAGFAPVFSGSDREGYVIRSNDLPAPGPQPGNVLRSVPLDDLEFPELPGTENELRSIIGLFAAKKSKAVGFFHSLATEKLFKSSAMNEYSIIHLATHSLTNETNPKLSGFLFYPPAEAADGEDGVLYAGEAYNLNLNCNLLVLSSCESGTGRLVAGEGLMSLTRGLFYSGARNIIFSLWKVEDQTTGDLMVKLYQDILRGESFALALQRAKLALIADPFTAFPKYWAGFIILGM